jgi:hypothetical protein
MKANQRMKALLHDVQGVSKPLPTALLGIGKAAFISEEGCYFLDALYHGRGNATLHSFPDETGYECFVNHLHLDDYAVGSANQVGLALTLMQNIKSQWRESKYSALPLEFVVSVDDSSCVLRFHVLRQGQRYLDEDLEAYKEDAVLVSDCESKS